MMTKRAGGVLTAPLIHKRPRLSDASSETSTGPAAEVAADFRDSLADLSMNDRYQISTLTIIAKENTEHASSISDVLLSHIRTVPPQRKLPALFVLDSIVKNVGTPYTIFLSYKLYNTFMDAYLLVDSNTRKQMESMLKTWKDPIPGSMDQKPVFPVDATRNIENALLRARTSSLEQQKNQNFPGSLWPSSHAMPPRPPFSVEQQWRNSPAPPSQFHAHQYPVPPQQAPYQSQYGAPPTDFQYAMQPPAYQSFQPPMPPPYPQNQYPAPPVRSPMPPPGFQAPYQPPPVSSFQPQYQPAQTRSPHPGYPTQFPPPPPQYGFQQAQPPNAPPPSAPPLMPPQSQQPGQLSLAALLQATGAPQPNGHHYPTQHQPTAAQFPGLDTFFQNRGSTPTQQYATPQMPSAQPNQTFATPPKPPPSALGSSAGQVPTINDAKLTAASLKILRPGLLDTLYPRAANSQCNTCGRRFPLGAEVGKQRKTRHLDAHFRTNMRMTSAADMRGSGVSRSWYIDEVEWISYREIDDADAVDEAAPQVAGASGTADDREEIAGMSGSDRVASRAKAAVKYITAPADAALRKQVCPICQEEFTAEYHEGDQEWVFMDAIKVPPEGDDAKIYHASCLEEMAKDRGS